MKTSQEPFHAFISYSRKDKYFAASLEKALEAYRHPSPDKKTMKLEVFRDEDDFAGSEYKKAILKHLGEAGKLLVICSPAARASTYVDEEIRLFASIHGSENIVPVIISGLPNNEAKENEEALMAFPPALCELMEMPLAVDYRGFDNTSNQVNKGSYYGAWCMLLANLLDTSRDVIDQRIRKRRAKILKTAITIVSLVALALASLAIWALIEKRNAVQRGEIILAEKLVSQSGAGGSFELNAVERRVLLALEGTRRLMKLEQPLFTAGAVLREALSLLPKKVISLNAGQTALTFAANGLQLFTASADSISVYNLISGKRIGGIKTSAPVTQLFVSESGRAVGALHNNGKLSFWSYPGWQSFKEITTPGEEQVLNAEIDKEGEHVAIATMYRESRKPAYLRIWKIDTVKQLTEQPIQHIGESLIKPGHGSCLMFVKNNLVTRVMVNPDDDSLTTILWKWRSFSNPYNIASPSIDTPMYFEWRCKDAALSADGESLYLIGKAGGEANSDKSSVTIVTTANGYVRTDASISSPQQVSMNGTVGIRGTFTEDPYVPLLKYSTFTATQLGTGEELGRVTEFSGTCWLSPQGDFIVTGVGSRVRLWHTTGGKEMCRIPVRTPINDLQIASSERFLSTKYEDGSIDVWDLASPSELLRIRGSKSIGNSVDGRLLASAITGGVMITNNLTAESSIHLIDGIAGKGVFSPLNKYLAVSTGDTWDFTSTVKQHKSTVLIDLLSTKKLIVSDTSETVTAFSTTGDSLLLGEKSGVLKFIQSTTGKIIWTKKLPGEKLTRVNISPDAKLVVVAMAAKWGYRHQLFVLDLKTGAIKMQMERTSDVAAINETSTQLATVKGDTVEVGDISTGRIINIFIHPQQYATTRQIVFKAGTGTLVTVSGNKASNFMASFFTGQAFFEWDIKSGKMLRQFPEGLSSQLDYKNSLSEEEIPYFSDVLCSPGGKFIAVIQYRSRLNYWALPGQYAVSELCVWKMDGLLPVEILRFPCSYEVANKLEAIAEETGIIISSGDHIRSWSLSGEKLFEEGCMRLSRNFTKAEWNEYVGAEEPWCKTCPGLK